MEPVLIYTDNTRIEREQNFFDDSVAIFQAIYDALTAFGITVTLEDVNNFVAWTKNQNSSPNFEQEFVINKMLDAATYVVNGVTVSREGMRSLMVAPDVTALKTALKAVGTLYSRNPNVNGVYVNLLVLADGVISKAEGADDTIAGLFTYYTNTDASATLANSIQTICDAMNTHEATYGNALVNGLGYGKNANGQAFTPFKGIAITNGIFVVSLSYIRSFERSGSLASES